MISRELEQTVNNHLAFQPAVALLGPRQVGKTTLAQAIAKTRDGPPVPPRIFGAPTISVAPAAGMAHVRGGRVAGVRRPLGRRDGKRQLRWSHG